MMQQTDVIFHLHRQITATTSSDLHEHLTTIPEQLLTQANPATTSTIILNCSELEPINSHGIRLLIPLLIYTRRQKKRLLFFWLSEHNRYIFEITRLNQFIDITDATTQAVAVVHTTGTDNSILIGGTRP